MIVCPRKLRQCRARNSNQMNSLETESTLPWDKGEANFYKVPTLVHFYADEKTKCAVLLIQIALSWLVIFEHPDWSL